MELDGGEIKWYYNKDSDPLLYAALKKRLEEFEGDGKKAFAGIEFHKPKADGSEGPIVKSVKIKKPSSSFLKLEKSNGIAKNENIVRCDVFYVENDGYYFVPVYVADTVKDTLPQEAPVPNKPPKLMNNEDFVFSLYPNDLIKIYPSQDITLSKTNKKSDLDEKKTVKQGEGYFLYYKSMDRANARLEGINHDNTYKSKSIGKTMQEIEKYEVDVLGNVRKVKKEKRMDYSGRKKSKK